VIELSLQGEVAVVTGGSRGIGAAIVELLARAGAAVVFSYRENGEAAERVIARCPSSDGVAALRADAAQPESAARLVDLAVRRFGYLSIAIANAGLWNADDIPIESLDPATWNEMIAVNLGGAYALARAAVAQFKRQPASTGRPRGRIILIASTAGQRGEAWHTHYGAAKGGVIALARGLAPEVAADGILVNCVAPGWVATDMSAPAVSMHPERIFEKIPLRRMGAPEEIAGPVLFLCTSWANFMTGSVVSVNGGAVLA
jgi:3-oxoacyl-[acyl-carrier protein] reductase